MYINIILHTGLDVVIGLIGFTLHCRGIFTEFSRQI